MTKDMNKQYEKWNRNTTRRAALSTFRINYKPRPGSAAKTMTIRAESESDARDRFYKTHKSSQILGTKYVGK